MSDLTSRIANLSPKQRALLERKRAVAASAGKSAVAEPIAVIGVGCHFPGGVTSLDSYWRLLEEGVDAITEVPNERWDIDAYFDPDPDAPGKMYTRWGGFLDNVDGFDARFFGIAPREAAGLDPQQRLLLEVAYEALEDAGQPVDELNGTRTGVFAGMMTNDYTLLNMQNYDPESVDVYSGSGVDQSFAAGRLSYALGLQGPSMVVATACSSALVAVHLACRSLQAGDCQLALAGGVNTILTPEATIYSCRIRSMAPDGRCKTFDAAADGYVRGEGCGVVVLKRFSDAVRDGDRVLALIRGSAINHDGRSAGLTVPNASAQQAVIRAALANGGVNPLQVGYVEAHGTGTSLGDPIEVRSLWSVLGPGRERPLWIGSAKTNVGHLEAAAGMAGLIKVVLALRHQRIPPHLHLKKLSPMIDWAQMKIEVPTEAVDWPSDSGPRIAGVSSFGLSGMNAHVVLEETPRETPQSGPSDELGRGAFLLPLSARSAVALAELQRSYAGLLSRPGVSLPGVCYTAAARRAHFDEHRVAAVGADAAELAAEMEREPAPRGSPGRRSPIAFVFPGQGGQWSGMARRLWLQEPVFRQAVEACDRAFGEYLDWSLVDRLEVDGEDWLREIAVVQPAIFGVQVALTALWRSWGVEPDCVLGHSMGEVAAAHTAGILTLEDAARIICRRSTLLGQLRGEGAMLLVELGYVEAAETLASFPGTSIAAANGPRSSVVAGDETTLQRLQAELERRAIYSRRVQVNVAAHTSQVDPLAPELAKALNGLRPSAGTVPFYSTVHGALFTGDGCDAAYWIANLRQPVEFWKALREAVLSGCRLFVEISPHPVLGASIRDGLAALDMEGLVLPSLKRDEDDHRVMFETLGALYVRGQRVDWRGVYPAGRFADGLPTYPWQHERYWLDTAPAGSARSKRGPRAALGERRGVSNQTDAFIWDLDLGPDACPYLTDHRVDSLTVVPAALYIALAVQAAQSISESSVLGIEDLRLERALVLSEDNPPRVQLAISKGNFQFASRTDDTRPWTVHAKGRVITGEPVTETLDAETLAAIRARCPQAVSGAEYYDALTEAGLEYGPAFRRIESLERGEGEAWAALSPTPAALQRDGFRLHPAVLDGGFQALGAALTDVGGAALPVAVRRVTLGGEPRGPLVAVTRMTGPLEGEVVLVDESGRICARAEGFRVQSLDQSSERDEIGRWLYRLEWSPAPRTASAGISSRRGSWLIVPDSGGLASSIAAALEASGEQVIIGGTEAIPKLAVEGILCRAVVYLAGLDDPSPAHALDLVRAVANSGWRDMPRLYLVTSGAAPVAAPVDTDAIEQSPLWGLARTLSLEHPEFACTCIDVHDADPAKVAQDLSEEMLSDDDEDQVALRPGGRYVARLVRYEGTGEDAAACSAPLSPAGDRPFRIEIDSPGILDNLTLRETTRTPLEPDEIEIEVKAAGLNFLDVLSAMGIRPDVINGPVALGGECAGVVTAVGEDVTELAVGDAVIAIAPFCFGTHVRTKAELATRKPITLSFAEGAAIPVASLTAYYALVHQARLRRGERILIHSASGGTGLAAVQIARHIGAEVFATAGTEQKRAWLRSLGIRHVMSSRSLEFAGEIQRLTEGRGVDVVLNSLAGEAIPASLSTLAPYGRFLEIGKRDIYENNQLGLSPFQRNLSYFAIDLARMVVERASFVREMLDEVVGLCANGSLGRIEVQTRPIAECVAAFHAMANAQHVGKIVLTLDERATTPIAPARQRSQQFHADGSYLITGGLGGLGLVLAEWLAERGAGHLVLVGRNAPGAEARTVIERIQSNGGEVGVVQADVARRDQLEAVLAGIPADRPLRGVFHAAAVLDDGTALRLERSQFDRVLSPKVDGARNLALLTRHANLDHFVMFSSAAATLGSPGQANYSAANAYLDALAHSLRAQGRRALSIGWGPWAEVGLAAAQANRGQRLATQGMASLTPAQGLEGLERLLEPSTPPHVAVMRINLRHWQQMFPGALRAPFLRRLVEESDLGDAPRRETGPERGQLLALPPTLRLAALETMLREMIGRVLRLRTDQIDVDTPLTSLGLDSLMGLELRNRLEMSFGVTLSATLVFGYPTVGALAPLLAERMGLSLEGRTESRSAARPASAFEEPRSPGLTNLEEISDDDAESLLTEKLASLGFEDK